MNSTTKIKKTVNTKKKKIYANPPMFVQEAHKKNIKYEYLMEAIECIGDQATARMFSGKSGRGGVKSLSSVKVWINTFETFYEDTSKKYTSNLPLTIDLIDNKWNEYIKLISTPIPEETVKYWKTLSNKKLGDEAIKNGITLGVRNGKALKTLLNRMIQMVERRRKNIWEREQDEIKTPEPVNKYVLLNDKSLRQLCKERCIVNHWMKKDDMVSALIKYDTTEVKIEGLNYRLMKNTELKNLCKKRNMTCYNKLNKKQLVEKLLNYDKDLEKIKEENKSIELEETKDNEEITTIENKSNGFLDTFKFDNKEIRTTGTFEKPWFVMKDIADILELKNYRTSYGKMDDYMKGLQEVETPGGIQNLSVINEAGVYYMIMRSNKPKAKLFQKFVYTDVLPSLRTKGTYTITNNKYNLLLENNSPLLEVMDRTDLDKEAEELEKEYDWYNYTNCQVVYMAYVGKGLVKIGYSDYNLVKREKRHMSSGTEFQQYRSIASFKVSSGLMEDKVKELMRKYRVKFNKQIEVYKPPKDLKDFVEMVRVILWENDKDMRLKEKDEEIMRLKEEIMRLSMKNI